VGSWSVRSQCGLLIGTVWKLGSELLIEAGKERPGLQMLTGTNSEFFWRP
jgi:hypothetical protein